MEWKAWIDSKLGTNFEQKAYDPQVGRDKLVKVIDKAAEQHSEGKTPPTRTWKTGGNNAIRFIPTLNGNPINLDEGKPAFVPAEHFQKFLTQLKASVQKGDLDKEIKTALETRAGGKATASTSSTSTGGGRDALSNVRSSIGRSISNGKTIEEAEAIARKKGKYSDADIATVIAEKRATK